MADPGAGYLGAQMMVAEMRLLPRSEWVFHKDTDGTLLVGAHVNGPDQNIIYWTRLDEFPYDDSGRGDSTRVVVDILDGVPVVEDIPLAGGGRVD